MVNPVQIIQYAAIVIDIFGVIVALVKLCKFKSGFDGFVRGVFVILVALFLLFGELYIFGFFRYFGFIFRNWGKGLAYLFMGAALFEKSGFGLFVAIVFWVLAIVYFVLAYFFKQVSLPLFQGGCSGSPPPSMSIDATEIYENNEKQMNIGHKDGAQANADNTNYNVDNTPAPAAAAEPQPAQNQYNDI